MRAPTLEGMNKTSVLEPNWFQCWSMRMRMRIQGFDDQKFKPIYSWKESICLVKKLQFTYPETSIKDVQGKVGTREAFSLKRGHPALQNMKFLNFFQFLWVTFALLDPDAADQNQCVGIQADVDPKHWTKQFNFYVFAIIHIVPVLICKRYRYRSQVLLHLQYVEGSLSPPPPQPMILSGRSGSLWGKYSKKIESNHNGVGWGGEGSLVGEFYLHEIYYCIAFVRYRVAK